MKEKIKAYIGYLIPINIKYSKELNQFFVMVLDIEKIVKYKILSKKSINKVKGM
jgi:hypothetical protein